MPVPGPILVQTLLLVVEVVQMHFKSLVFYTIIRRNVRVSEAPSYGIPAISYDADCKGSLSYMNLAKELIKKNKLSKEAIW